MRSCSYFLYLYMVLLILFSQCFIEQFSMIFSAFKTQVCHSKIIWTFQNHWVESSTQYSWIIHGTCFIRLLYILSTLLYKCSFNCQVLPYNILIYDPLVHIPSTVPTPLIFTYGAISNSQSPSHESSSEIVKSKGNPTPRHNPPNLVPNVPADPDSDQISSYSSL